MKILQTIGGMGEKSGGTSSCTFQLFNAFEAAGNEDIDLLTVKQWDGSPLLGEGSRWLKALEYDHKTPVAYSASVARFLKEKDYDLYHTNGIWMYINHATCAVARRNRKPYVITPHGMLYADALKRSRWKKIPLELLWFRKDIMKASCIHVTCEAEMKQVRNYGYRGPIALIGNPIEVPPFIDEINQTPPRNDDGRIKIGFLGRLHPIKQIELIIQGLAITPEANNVDIVIMGAGSDEYLAFLKNEASRLGLADRVQFKGFVSGKEKFEELSRLSALFVPSDMENFGMIIPEALLVNTPVMASLGTPWQSLEENRCGWWREASAESVSAVIKEIIRTSPSQLREMGRRGAEMVRAQFAAPVIATKLRTLYQWLLDSSTTCPRFVHTVKSEGNFL